MTNNNYYTVQAFMVKELELKGLDLNIFAIIYGFSQDGKTYFRGSINYLMEWTGASKRAIINSLNDLTEKELLIKKKDGKYSTYKVNINRCKNYTPQVQKVHSIGAKSAPNNIYDNIEIIKDKQINNNKNTSLKEETRQKISEEYTKDKLSKETIHPLTKTLVKKGIISLSDEETLQASNMLYNANLFFDFDRVKTSFFYTLNKINKSKRVIQNKFRYFAKSFIQNLEKNDNEEWYTKLYNKEGTPTKQTHQFKNIDLKKYGLDL